jgi:beta-glucuronidase
VYVDGQSLGDHRAGGYQPFWITVPASSEETRELLVLVDNRFNSTTAPTHTGGRKESPGFLLGSCCALVVWLLTSLLGDFWHYGGITRDVILHEQPGAMYLERVETFTLDTAGNIKVNVVVAGQDQASSIDVRAFVCNCLQSPSPSAD